MKVINLFKGRCQITFRYDIWTYFTSYNFSCIAFNLSVRLWVAGWLFSKTRYFCFVGSRKVNTTQVSYVKGFVWDQEVSRSAADWAAKRLHYSKWDLTPIHVCQAIVFVPSCQRLCTWKLSCHRQRLWKQVDFSRLPDLWLTLFIKNIFYISSGYFFQCSSLEYTDNVGWYAVLKPCNISASYLFRTFFFLPHWRTQKHLCVWVFFPFVFSCHGFCVDFEN